LFALVCFPDIEMNAVLKVSLCGNLVLFAIVLCLMARIRSVSRNPTLASQAAPTHVESADQTTNLLEEPRQAVISGFHWSQLESSNYTIYIANLRCVGCPEQTIRDIITADVDSFYAPKREQIERNQSQRDLQELRQEEALLLSKLLGSPSTVPQVAPFRGEPALGAPVLMPLALENLQAREPKLSEQQMQVIDDLRHRFQQEIGTEDSDPNDPAYRQRWEIARRENDDLLQALLGGEFFLQYQLLASQQTAEP